MRRRWRVHLVTALATLVVMLVPQAAIGATSSDDPCDLVPTDLVTSFVGSDGSPFGDGAAWCNWQGELTSVSVVLDPNSFDALRDAYPGGEDVDVSGTPGYRFGSAADGFGTFSVLVPMGQATLMLTVSSSDPELATDALSVELAEAALAGGASASSGTGAATPEPAASTPVESFCAHLTSDDVSAAIGIEVQLLPNQTIPWSCGWVGGNVAVEINQVDAATIEGLAADFGGVAVEGLPFQAWWASEHDLLHVLSDDVAFHVFMASDDTLDDAEAKAKAVAVANVFLATRGGG